jgi:DNA-binding response OmpR family regulator
MADSPLVEFDILFVEDNPGDRDLIIEHLEASGRSFHVEASGSLGEALQNRNKRNFDIVLLDLGLPDSMGLETLTRFRSHAPEIPIIVLTGLDDDEAGIEAIRNGAQDYLVKGQVNAHLLVRSLLHAIERHLLKGKVDHYNMVLRAIRNIISSSSGKRIPPNSSGRLVKCSLRRAVTKVSGPRWGIAVTPFRYLRKQGLRPVSVCWRRI